MTSVKNLVTLSEKMFIQVKNQIRDKAFMRQFVVNFQFVKTKIHLALSGKRKAIVNHPQNIIVSCVTSAHSVVKHARRVLLLR